MIYIRTYPFVVPLNGCKEKELLLILREYRRVAGILRGMQINNFIRKGTIDKSHKLYQSIVTSLSERYKDVIKRQVDGMFSSFISNIKNKLKEYIGKSSIKDKKLYYTKISRNEWIGDKLLGCILKHLLKTNSYPTTSGINMLLNTKVYKLEKSKDSVYAYWIRLCTGVSGKFIYIPLKANKYFNCKLLDGVSIFNAIQVNFKDNKLFNISLMLNHPDDTSYVAETDKIAIDRGLNVAISTNKGNLYGLKYYKQLKYYDNIIQNTKSKTTKKKYTTKLKKYIKNELNRIINKIVNVHKPAEIILEKLNFKNSNLSKQLNRILHNCGIGTITKKLEAIKQEKNIKATYINPAYTSQECSHCHYTDEKNRKQSTFICKKCNYTKHADINSTYNILRRSTDDRINLYTPFNKIKQLLNDKHMEFVTNAAKVRLWNETERKLT